MAVKNGKMEIIDSRDKLREFIGTIDNLEEVIISIKLNDYWFDRSDERTGTYRKTENGYDLQILDFESCPVKYKSVQATLDFNGKLEVHSIETIREEPDCVIS
jgi:hypothetical protein